MEEKLLNYIPFKWVNCEVYGLYHNKGVCGETWNSDICLSLPPRTGIKGRHVPPLSGCYIPSILFLLIFETGSHYVVLAGLELTV